MLLFAYICVYLFGGAHVLATVDVDSCLRQLSDHPDGRTVFTDNGSYHVAWHQDSGGGGEGRGGEGRGGEGGGRGGEGRCK